MAETVKKSRIVSETDDNLEDALMEEFNMRLKKCMSQDDLQQQEPPTQSEKEDINAQFIKAEQDHYDVPPSTNGYHNNVPEEAVYEDIEEASAPEVNLIPADLSEEEARETESVKSVKDRMFLSTDVESCLLFTQTVTSPMLTPSEENVDFLKGFKEEQEVVYENLKGGDEEAIYENLKDRDFEHEDEVIYENLKDRDEVIYENVKEGEEEVEILREVEINSVEHEESTQVTESYVETTTIDTNSSEKGLKKKKTKKTRKEEKENISVKSSFSKFDALQKKNVLHARSSDSSKAQEKFNGSPTDSSTCRSCDKPVFQMEQIKAEKQVWHRNCFRCTECNKQLNVDTYQSNEGTLYCNPHFKALFAPKAVEDDTPPRSRKPELIIRENQPMELPPDVVRASDKPDLGLEELQSLNVKERFQVFEHHQSSEQTSEERLVSAVNVKRSPSILSKLAKFQAKGMDIGVTDDSLNGIPIEESSSEEEQEEEEEDGLDGEDADLIRAKRVQKEKPFHFTGMSDVKSKWEQGEQMNSRDERREERKQEIQSIRNRIFMGKQGKMKEAYQQAVMESESCTNLRKEPIEVCDTKSLKEKFEKGEVVTTAVKEKDNEETEVYESEISKKSRSLFLELDANASKPPHITPIPTPKIDVKKVRDSYIMKTANEDTVKSSPTNVVEDVEIRTADIQQRFKFFETYREPEKEKRAFRMTPPREGQDKSSTPEREIYRDPEIVRSEEVVEDSVVARQSHTATKMLNKFRQMEEDLQKEPSAPQGPKPLKRFTPPPEPQKQQESGSEEEEEEEESEDEGVDEVDEMRDADLMEAQKAARAKHLRAKFERWEAEEINREQHNHSSVNIIEEFGEDQSQIESTKTLRARFESMRNASTNGDAQRQQPKVKVNRFVELANSMETCESCNSRVYPLEKISVHNHIYHKNCFKCMECHCVLRMDSYSYNQGLLYCMPHFKRLFISKGNYDTAFGLGPHKEKWNATVA